MAWMSQECSVEDMGFDWVVHDQSRTCKEPPPLVTHRVDELELY